MGSLLVIVLGIVLNNCFEFMRICISDGWGVFILVYLIDVCVILLKVLLIYSFYLVFVKIN